ncbi:hypothetical protein ACPWML_27000, partial [Pandoraea pneumonica]|uniref:hypothetical protein n=1 Tax=Pandoraea pneumonica TaxID=2508299 RepID=UPI003CEAE9A4
GDYDAYHARGGEMGRMAKSLERDPQLESVLRGRDRRDLGLDFEMSPHRKLSHDLASSIGHELGRGLGMSR